MSLLNIYKSNDILKPFFHQIDKTTNGSFSVDLVGHKISIRMLLIECQVNVARVFMYKLFLLVNVHFYQLIPFFFVDVCSQKWENCTCRY